MNVIRDHDKIYLNENWKDNPKENFKFIANYSSKFISSLSIPSILDIGCATGDFIYYLSKTFPDAKYVGLDVMPELLEKARKEVSDAIFIQADISNNKSLPNDRFDVIFMIGVHSIFDDIFLILDNVISLLKKNGRVYVFNFFNDENIDVLVKARPSSTTGPWQVGWNLFSKKSITDYIKNKGLECEFIDWEIPIDLSKNFNDSLRSWTFKNEHKKRMVINGTGILHTFSLLVIKT